MDQDLAFDWDEANIGHVARHDIRANEVEEVFCNRANDLRYEVVNGEERWTSVGHSNQWRVLVVVWTMRGEAIRPVTAFSAGRAMAKQYMEERGS